MQIREQTMVKELCALEDGLKPHELKFVEDLSHKSQGGYQLSEAQLKWLEAIWNREVLKKCR